MNNNNQYHKYTIMYLVGGIGFSLALLFYDYDINNFLSIPSFMMVIAPIIVVKMALYLVPTTQTIYDKIISCFYKEIILTSGLSGCFMGWVLMGKGAANDGVLNQISNLWGGYAAAFITVVYSLSFALLYIGAFNQESNIEPDKNCFEIVEERKRINYRFIISIFIYLSIITGTIGYVLFFEGASGGFGGFLPDVASISLILVVFILTVLRTNHVGYIKTFKIIFYDQYGDYDIKQISLSIKTAKELIINISILLLCASFVEMISLNFDELFNAIGNLSAGLLNLLLIYQFLIVQDAFVLQNAILKDKFYQYSWRDSSPSLYVLIAIFLGILSFILLLNLIRM